MRSEVQSRFRALLAGIALTAALLLCGMFAAQAQAAIQITEFEAGAFNADGTPNLQAGAHPFEARTFFKFAESDDDGTPSTGARGERQGHRGDAAAGADRESVDHAAVHRRAPLRQRLPGRQPGRHHHLRLWQGTEQFPIRLPVYNMVPDPGQTADFAFQVIIAPVHIVATLNTDGDYSLKTNISDISELLPLGASTLSFWGVPADSAHDQQRGACIGTDTEQIDTDGDGFPDVFGDGDPSTTTPARPVGQGSPS